MDDAMLWTVIGTFITALAALIAVAGFLLARIDRTLERLDGDVRKLHDETTQIKASLASIGERLTRGGI